MIFFYLSFLVGTNHLLSHSPQRQFWFHVFLLDSLLSILFLQPFMSNSQTLFGQTEGALIFSFESCKTSFLTNSQKHTKTRFYLVQKKESTFSRETLTIYTLDFLGRKPCRTAHPQTRLLSSSIQG